MIDASGNSKKVILAVVACGITFLLSGCGGMQHAQLHDQSAGGSSRIPEAERIPVIVGGYHITEIPENLTESMDVGVIGEGEYTLLELVEVFRSHGSLQSSALTAVDGIVYWDSGEQIQTQNREVVGKSTKSLDELPMPDRDMMRVRPHSNMLPTNVGE